MASNGGAARDGDSDSDYSDADEAITRCWEQAHTQGLLNGLEPGEDSFSEEDSEDVEAAPPATKSGPDCVKSLRSSYLG